jgi:hypothetical protein
MGASSFQIPPLRLKLFFSAGSIPESGGIKGIFDEKQMAQWCP